MSAEKSDMAAGEHVAERPGLAGASPEVHVDAAVQIAHETQEGQYSPWTKSMFRLYGILIIGAPCHASNISRMVS